MDFKESGFMYLLGCLVVVFVITQSLFFMKKAWSHGRTLGLSSATLKKTAVSSMIFTFAPALAILATVITIAGALGLVVPWIRLSIIGNIGYEVTAAHSTLESFGIPGGLSLEVKDKTVFAATVWVMTIGSVMPLILLPLFLKKIQKKIGKTVNSNAKWADTMSAAAFIGLIAAFIARSVAGSGDISRVGDGAGVLSVCTLVSAMFFMFVLQRLSKMPHMKWLDPFAMPLSMLLAMGLAMLLAQVLPQNLVTLEWRG